MKNLIIVLFFLFTTSSLLAVNNEFKKNNEEIISQLDISKINIKSINTTDLDMDLFKDEYGNCKIDITITNSDGETIATIHVDTNTETAEECNNIRDIIIDMANQ